MVGVEHARRRFSHTRARVPAGLCSGRAAVVRCSAHLHLLKYASRRRNEPFKRVYLSASTCSARSFPSWPAGRVPRISVSHARGQSRDWIPSRSYALPVAMRWMESPPPATPGAVVAPSSCHRSDSCCRGRRTASPGLRRSPLRNLLWWVVAASVAAAVRGPAPWGATVVAVERPSDRQPVAPFPPATAAGTTGGAAVAAGPAPLGRLHTLPSLVCDVDAPASRGGGRGFWFTSPSECDRGGARVWVPRGNGTCDAPFTDTSMMELEGISTGSSSPGGACVTKRNRRSGSYRSDDLRPKGARWASVLGPAAPVCRPWSDVV